MMTEFHSHPPKLRRELREMVLDKENKAEVYFVYIRKLIREGFCGDVTVTLFKGGIRSLNKDSEPVIRLKVKETVKLKG